jgi:hypothetical protein
VEKLRLLNVEVEQSLLNRITGTCGILLALEAITKGPQGFRVVLSVPKRRGMNLPTIRHPIDLLRVLRLPALGRVEQRQDAICHLNTGPLEMAQNVKQLSLSRLNHWLPGHETHPKGMECTAQCHHKLADTLLPQVDAVFEWSRDR